MGPAFAAKATVAVPIVKTATMSAPKSNLRAFITSLLSKPRAPSPSREEPTAIPTSNVADL
jgi:hypothetical protein